MIKPRDPRELAVDLLPRSTCAVQVAAVACDVVGNIISWGWNNVGSGFGQHAEEHCIIRANQKRLHYGTIYVATQRKRNVKTIISKPCFVCQYIIDKRHMKVVYRDGNGKWVRIGSAT